MARKKANCWRPIFLIFAKKNNDGELICQTVRDANRALAQLLLSAAERIGRKKIVPDKGVSSKGERQMEPAGPLACVQSICG